MCIFCLFLTTTVSPLLSLFDLFVFAAVRAFNVLLCLFLVISVCFNCCYCFMYLTPSCWKDKIQKVANEKNIKLSLNQFSLIFVHCLTFSTFAFPCAVLILSQYSSRVHMQTCVFAFVFLTIYNNNVKDCVFILGSKPVNTDWIKPFCCCLMYRVQDYTDGSLRRCQWSKCAVKHPCWQGRRRHRGETGSLIVLHRFDLRVCSDVRC